MNKLRVIVLCLVISNSLYSQYSQEVDSSSKISYLRVGAGLNLGFFTQRSMFFPQEVIQSSYYQQHFGEVPTPEKTDWATVNFQFTGSMAWVLNSYKLPICLELGIEGGYQNSMGARDDVYMQFESSNDTFVSHKIDVNYKLHELVAGGYALIKGNSNEINGFIGVGFNNYFSIGHANITESFQENETLTYRSDITNYAGFNVYVPFGFEVPLNTKNTLFVKYLGTVRREFHPNNAQPKRYFLTFGAHFQYQF